MSRAHQCFLHWRYNYDETQTAPSSANNSASLKCVEQDYSGALIPPPDNLILGTSRPTTRTCRPTPEPEPPKLSLRLALCNVTAQEELMQQHPKIFQPPSKTGAIGYSQVASVGISRKTIPDSLRWSHVLRLHKMSPRMTSQTTHPSRQQTRHLPSSSSC